MMRNSTHERLMAAAREEIAALRAKLDVLVPLQASYEMQAKLQWVRIVQLEKERAILFKQVTNLPIPVPDIFNTPEIATSADRVLQKFGGIFDHIETDEELAYIGERVPTS